MTDFDIAKAQELEHRTEDASAPEVFFTPVITPESLVAAYHALGARPEGKVAIKIHSGESEKSNNLNPALVRDLVQEIGGTLVECATAYDGNRETPEKMPCRVQGTWIRGYRTDPKSWTWAVKSKISGSQAPSYRL